MFLVLLKHFIYEKCINVLFNVIGHNFKTVPVVDDIYLNAERSLSKAKRLFAYGCTSKLHNMMVKPYNQLNAIISSKNMNLDNRFPNPDDIRYFTKKLNKVIDRFKD